MSTVDGITAKSTRYSSTRLRKLNRLTTSPLRVCEGECNVLIARRRELGGGELRAQGVPAASDPQPASVLCPPPRVHVHCNTRDAYFSRKLMSNSWTLAQTFAARVREHADRTLLVANGRSLSYGQVDAKSSALAAALAELGIEAGDRIAIVMPNWPEWVLTLLAAAKLGAIVVPLNSRLSYHEFKYQLRHAEVSVVFSAERRAGVDYLQMFEDIIAELPDLQYLVTVGDQELWYDDRIFQFEDLLSSGDGREYPVPAGLQDSSDLAMLYTSGTMGKPKGVRLSHRTVVETAVHTSDALEMEPSDRVLVSVPLFTSFGFSIVVGTMAAGATIVLQDTFEPAHAIALMHAERITVMHGVPTMYHMLMRAPEFNGAAFPLLRTGIVAGGPVQE